MSNDIAIKVDGVSKSFKLPHERTNSFKSALINFRKRKKGYETQHVLTDISFEIKKGEFFGIVGRNGSGKSTLLKLISQIYTPDKGSITIDGKLTPFIELGVGFNPELSGRDNVYLNGALFGFSRAEMTDMYDEIVEFAELEKFMDQKLKNYSSGMQVRLAFSIAIRANTDILVLDEVLAVGDEAFQRKCFQYFATLKKTKKTVILVTHSMDSVKKYCNKAVLIHDGSLKMFGEPSDIANEYTNENITVNTEGGNKHKHSGFEPGLSRGIPEYQIKLKTKKLLSSSDDLVFDIEYKITPHDTTVDAVVIEINDISRSNAPILLDALEGLGHESGFHTIRYKYSLKNINDGDYRVSSTLRDEKKDILAYTTSKRSADFAIRNNDNISPYPLLRESGTVVRIESR